MQWCCVGSLGWALICCRLTTPDVRETKLCRLQQRTRRCYIHRRGITSRSQTSSSARWNPIAREPFHFWNYCEICGNGDGILICDACQGQGIVATKPGGAGVPFYIGNAQCSVCKGHGFEPCPVCIGYQANLPAPAPHEGPSSWDNLGNRLSTTRWLRSFPDSRAQSFQRRQRLRRAQQEGNFTALKQGQKTLSSSTGKPVVDKAVWESLARQFYTMHGALRQKR